MACPRGSRGKRPGDTAGAADLDDPLMEVGYLLPRIPVCQKLFWLVGPIVSITIHSFMVLLLHFNGGITLRMRFNVHVKSA